MCILNLTQHNASPEQLKAGVIDMTMAGQPTELKELLTFDNLPSREDVNDRAKKIADWAEMEIYCSGGHSGDNFKINAVMIGGAPFLMAPLVKQFRKKGIRTLFAFSKRVSEEDPKTGRKISVFKHEGFVTALERGEIHFQ